MDISDASEGPTCCPYGIFQALDRHDQQTELLLTDKHRVGTITTFSDKVYV